MEHILWAGDHLGAYLWDKEKNGVEISLFKILWSPVGAGFIAFVRFTTETGFGLMNGVYTDNKKVSKYMMSVALKKGKPQANIANQVKRPLFEATRKRKNNLPKLLTEKIIAKNGSIEIRWLKMSNVKFNFPKKTKNLPIRYSFIAGKVDVAEIIVNGQSVVRSKFKNGNNKYSSMAFVALSEIWIDSGN